MRGFCRDRDIATSETSSATLNRLWLERSQRNPSVLPAHARRNDWSPWFVLSQENHVKTPCMPILRSCVLSRLLSSDAEDAFLCLFLLTHVKAGGPALRETRPKDAIMHSAAFSCVSADAEQFSSVHYYIRNGMMLFHATSAESICTSISLLTARQQRYRRGLAISVG